jgi:predicted PurR-regulated permease PerM
MNYIILSTIYWLVILLLFLVIYNLFTKTEKLEKLVDDQNTYIGRLSELIELSNNKIGESEIANAFKSDDEIGFFFDTLKEIQDKLNSFKLKK